MSSGDIAREISRVKGLSPLILTPDDWNPYEQHEGIPFGAWPTLEYLRQRNKRLIIFDSKIESELQGMYYQWFYTFENQYGTLDIKDACAQRDDSKIASVNNALVKLIKKVAALPDSDGKVKPTGTQLEKVTRKERVLKRLETMTGQFEQRTLYVMNYFAKGVAKNPEKDNSVEQIDKLINCTKKKEWLKGRNPNFIALDQVHQGNGMAVVNRINAGRILK